MNKAMQWIVGRDTGISSKTIWAVMMGVVTKPTACLPGTGLDPPHDPSDFGRCYRLLELIPEWKPRMSEVGQLLPKWKPLTDHWDELTALYEEEVGTAYAFKLYARMKVLLDEGMVLDGWVQVGPNGWERKREAQAS